MAPVLDRYGYLAVAGFIFLEDFGTPFVPGETVLIAAAVYAGAGRLDVVAVGLLGFMAAVLGDNVGFAIGHFVGREAVARWGRYVLLTEERLARAEAFFARHGGKIVAVARFVDGLRQANGIVAGLTEMPWLSFLLFNVLGAAAWVGCWVAVGYSAGSHITPIYNWSSRVAVYVLVAGAAAVGLLVARRLLRRRSRRPGGHRAAQGPGGPPGQGAETGPGQGAEAGPGQGAETGPGQGAEAGPGQGAETGPGQGAEAGPGQGAGPRSPVLE